MKKITLFASYLFLVIPYLYSQDCELSSEANKHKIRGEIFMEAATTPEDYKKVADEWEKAIALAPDCSELLYNLAIVYGEIGEFQQAKRYLDKYAALDKSDAAKQDAEILLIKLEVKKEIKENELVKKFVGKWKHYRFMPTWDTVDQNWLKRAKLRGDIIGNYMHQSVLDIEIFADSDNRLKVRIEENFRETRRKFNDKEVFFNTLGSNSFAYELKFMFGTDEDVRRREEHYELHFDSSNRLVGKCKVIDFAYTYRQAEWISTIYFEKQ